MCKFCDVNKGEVQVITTSATMITVGGNTKATDGRLTMYMIQDKDGWYHIDADYSLGLDITLTDMQMYISFCPFCGRKLVD